MARELARRQTGLSDPRQGIRTEGGRMWPSPRSVQTTVLCSALQVTPMSHLHPTYRALHITPGSAPMLKRGLALVSTGEAWLGQTFTPD